MNTVPLRYAQSLLRLTSLSQDELRAELSALKLPFVLLQANARDDATISTEDYGRLFVHLVRQMQDTLPGSAGADSQAMDYSAYRMLFQAMLHAGNLEQAMRRASVYFQRLSENSQTFALEVKGDLVCCRFDFSDESEADLSAAENFSMDSLNWLPGSTGNLLSMSMWHRVCSWFIGSYIDLQSVEMTRPAGDKNKNFADVFGTPVTFKANQNAWYFHNSYLQYPVVQSEDSLTHMLSTYPAELLRIDTVNESVSSRVRALIGTDFRSEMPTLQDVANRLHMTTPTLHRRLREQGTSFQKLKDANRKDAAINYLTSGNYTTAQLAEMMGFSDSSTFHRAFKKWTGVTPQEYE